MSVEPMLSGINIGSWLLDEDGLDVDGGWPQNYDGLDLVICGAETGPCKRPFKDEWALDLRDQCRLAGTPFFFKKDGSGKPTLCGVEYHEWVK
jgi:protein gp37